MRKKIFIEQNKTKKSVQTILLRLLNPDGRGEHDRRGDANEVQHLNDL